MTKSHTFGGDWTSEKLERLRKYLQAYALIFEKNERARFFHTVYVDAFAGTGYRTRNQPHADMVPLIELAEEDNISFLKGSARIALEIDHPLKEYIFIERDPEHAAELHRLPNEYPAQASKIRIINEDANSFLLRWCASTNWQNTRAVVFLDPYGMQVDWPVIEALGKTKAVDLWLLFPLGVAVNRLLTRSAPPPEAWANALTRIFGTDAWVSAFYPVKTQQTLWGEEEIQSKQADFKKISDFFVQHLATVFTAVSPQPLALLNTRNNPLYLLCFACGNPKVASTALRIANNILRS